MQISMLNMLGSTRMVLEIFFLSFLGKNVSNIFKWILDLLIGKKE